MKNAKWIKVGLCTEIHECTNCGSFLDFNGVNDGHGTANFCPVCGAKMYASNTLIQKLFLLLKGKK